MAAAALFPPLSGFPETGPDELEFTFTFPPPVIVPADKYVRISLKGCESWQVTGRPIVPFKGTAVLIPEGKEVAGIAYETTGEIVLPGRYYLEPAGAPYPLSRPDLKREALPDPEIYASSLPYPERIVSEENSQRKSGYRLLFFNLYPVSYLPREGRISYYPNIRVTVTLQNAPRKSGFSIPAVRGLAADREAVARLVLNPESIRTYRPVPQKSGVNPADSYSHVIITGSALAAYFEPLRDHRISRGLSSAIVTVEDIVSNPDYRWDGAFGDGVAWADDTAARIRNFIRDAYQNRGTEYVLLGGDYSVVPFRLFWVVAEDPDPGGPYIDEMPSDNYFGCLDGSYNGNGNSRWGEETDGPGGGDVDLTFEVHVGRAGVNSPAQIANLTAKIIAYEESVSETRKKVLMAGEHLGFGGDSEYAKPSMEEIRLGSSAHGYTTEGFVDSTWFESSDTLYDMDATWSKTDLINRFNGGIAVTNHLGHASSTYCMKLHISDFTSLTNSEYFFGYTQGCSSGRFDTGGCWCEEITRNEHGAFAFIGNTRYGFGLSNSTDGPSQKFNRPFWHGQIAEGIRELGALNTYSKEYNIPRINEPVSRWVYYELTLFGDPATRLHDGSVSPSPTPAASATPTPTSSPTAAVTASPTMTSTATSTATPTATATSTATPTVTPTAPPTAPPTVPPTTTPTAKPSSTPTSSPSPTVPPSPTPSPSPTVTTEVTPSPSPSPTSIPASTPSATGTGTPTPTPIPFDAASYTCADGDYNGDGTDDIAIYRPQSGLWAIRGLSRAYFGGVDDIPVPGDYRGDGTAALAVFRPGPGIWLVRNLTAVRFGRMDDLPVPGDYDGDGTCDRGIFRDEYGLWAVESLTRVYFGIGGDLPIPGDYSGEGTTGIGIFRPDKGLWALRGISRIYFGARGDTPLAVDYDGDRRREIGLFRPASGLWAIKGITRAYFGNSQDRPIPADFTGAGFDTIGIFRDSSGLWSIRGWSRVYFGTTGDIPVTR